MSVRRYVALFGVIALSACATIRPSDTQPLLTSATALRTNLHNEAAAVDTAFGTITGAADAVCANAALQTEFPVLCAQWKAASQPENAPATPESAERRASDTARRSLASAADAGMDEIVGYFQAVHAMAEAGEQSVAAADSVNRRLGALSGLLGGADGPLGFVTSDIFGTVLKSLAEAQAARQVRRTLTAATGEAQLTLDLYALAMRNALGACNVRPPPALVGRIRANLPRAVSGLENGAALAEQAETALNTLGEARDPCHAASYPDVVRDMSIALEPAEQFSASFNFVALRNFRTHSRNVTATMDEVLARLAEAGAFSGRTLTDIERDSIREDMQRLRDLIEVQEILAPYRQDADAIEQRVRAARRFDEDRIDGATRLARSFFALAQQHDSFRELVRKRRGLDLSRLLGGEEPDAPASGGR